MTEEYYINQNQCSCSNSPYFLINNLFKELDTEKKKKLARLNLGLQNATLTIDISNYMDFDSILPDGIYYYKGFPTIAISSKLNSKVVNPDSLVEEFKTYLIIKYKSNSYVCYLNGGFIKNWEENAPIEIQQIFNDAIVSQTNNGLMSAQDKIKLDSLPDENQFYTKEETYNKEELNNLITTPDVQYKVFEHYNELPIPGQANTIYRVSSYNGEYVDSTKFSEYAWNGIGYILLDVKDYNLAIKEDFDNPIQEQRDKIPTVGTLLDVNIIPKKISIISEGTITIKPNTLYKFGTCTSLSIAFDSDTSFSDSIKEYMFEFTVSGLDFILTLPEGIRWNEEPDLENGYTYQVSIVDNLAVFGEFEPISNE